MKKTCFLAVIMASTLLIPAIANTRQTAEIQTQEQAQTPNRDLYADIKFDTLRINFGTFSEKDPVQKCSFKFTNTGTAPLVIHQALASCGCTVPTYTKESIAPGKSGELKVVYNGKGKLPGRFKKTVSVRSNASNALVRVYIEGEMVDKQK